LTLSKKVKRLVGIELIKEAVEDAKFNCQLNKVENCNYICGKVEDTLKPHLENIDHNSETPVVIVGPPRG
jgi:tRNA (uracil-5-)-methyltransferase